MDHICEASRGTLSGWPTHVAPGRVGACVKSLQALFGGFQSHPPGWVSLDPSLLETAQGSDILILLYIKHWPKGRGSCENWGTSRDPPETRLGKQRLQGLVWTGVGSADQYETIAGWLRQGSMGIFPYITLLSPLSPQHTFNST